MRLIKQSPGFAAVTIFTLALGIGTAIVDSNLARRLHPSGDLLGTPVHFGVQPELQGLQVVGVARSARLLNLRDPNALVIYVPSSQHPSYSDAGNLFVRTANTAGIGPPYRTRLNPAAMNSPPG